MNISPCKSKNKKKLNIISAIAALLALVALVIGMAWSGINSDQIARADGGGAAGTGSGGTDQSGEICRSRVFHDDYNGDGNPTQGWEGDSSRWFYQRMVEVMGGRELGNAAIPASVYWDAADRALDRARNRTEGASKARVIGVCWVYTYGKGDTSKCYLARSWIPDYSQTASEWMLPSPNTPNGPAASSQGTNRGWMDPAWGEPCELDPSKTWAQYIRDLACDDVTNELGAYTTELSVIVIAVADTEPQCKGQVEIQKKAKPGAEWSTSNNQYSLNGATYGVYEDAACTSLVTSFTTAYDQAHGNGYGISEKIKKGSYYLKEISPSPGYTLSTEVYPIEILSGKVTSTSKPVYEDPPAAFAFGIEKMDYNRYVDKSGNAPQGAASLVGAKYKITYADRMCTTAEEVRAHKWSRWNPVTVETKLVGNRAIASYSSSQMIDDGNGGKTLPIGTYLIEEIQPPLGYHLTKDALENQSGYLVQVRRDSVTGAAVVHAVNASSAPNGTTTKNPASDVLDKDFNNTLVSLDMVKRADVSINKFIEITTDPDQYPSGKKPATGVKFQIINNNSNEVRRVDVPDNKSHAEKYAAKNQVVYTLTTNGDGWCSTSQLANVANQTGQSSGHLPVGSYIIREVPGTQPDGYDVIEDQVIEIGWNKKGDCSLKCCSTAGEWNHGVADNAANANTGGDRNFVFNDSTGTVVKIVKKDAGTGKVVRGETKFQVLDANKNVMSFDLPYPSSGTTSILTTSIDGTTILPDKFMPGTYYIREVAAPSGYLWNSKEIAFTCNTQTTHDHGTYDSPYEVVFSDNPAMGQIELTKSDIRTGQPIVRGKAEYDVYAAEDIVTEDGTVRATRDEKVDTILVENGTGTSKELFLGEYYLKESPDCVPEGYLLNNDTEYVTLAYADDKTPITISKRTVSDSPVYGKIGAEKRDAESGKLIPDASVTFAIYAAEDIVGGDNTVWHHKGDKLDEITTGPDGRATSDRDYELGSYEVVELNAPGGYAIDSAPVSVTLEYADATTPQVQAWATKTNNAQTFVLSVEKLDRETGRIVPLANTSVCLYAAEDICRPEGTLVHSKDVLVDTIQTDANGIGKTKVDNIICGNYYLKEVRAPYGYVLDADRKYDIKLAWEPDGRNVVQVTAAISDVPAKGRISFTKVDAESGLPVKVEGCKAEVYANEDIVTGDGTVRAHKDEKVADLTTDANGTNISKELYLGSYRIVETEAPYGYLINEVPVNVVLQYDNENVPVVTAASQIGDANAMGIIEITKRDKETGNVIPFKGTVFEIRAKTDIVTGDGTVRLQAGAVADTIKTETNGIACSKKLYLGAYTVQEVTAPTGYTLDTNTYDAIIAYKDQHTPVTTTSTSIENVAQKGIISVTKHDSESNLPVLSPDAVFEVVANGDIVTADGTVHAHDGEVVDTITTDDNGVASTKALYLGTYTVREVQAPRGYLSTNEAKVVTLSYGDQVEPLVYEGTEIANQPVKGQIIVTKTDAETSEPLAGVEYEIRADEDIISGDGIVRYKKGEVVKTICTDESGTATSPELYLGEYAVVETIQPDGYELDRKEYQAHLRYIDEVTAVVSDTHELTNVPSHIFVKKVSTNDESEVLPNTHFVGWRKSDESNAHATFAVFAPAGYEISSASVDYFGKLSNDINNDEKAVEKTFTLTQTDQEDETAYHLYTSNEPANQGEYVMHLRYSFDGKDVTEDIEFVINEHDTNAIFALGGILEDEAESSNCFPISELPIPAPTPDVGNDAEPDQQEVAADDTIESNVTDPDPVDDMLGNEANRNNEDLDNDIESDEDNSGDVSGDADSEEPSENETNETTSVPSSQLPSAKRVPVVLAHGTFAYSVTGEDGLAEFKYVPQGEIGFAEYMPPTGYASDRTPQYAIFADDGMIENHEELEQIPNHAANEGQNSQSNDQSNVETDDSIQSTIQNGDVIGLRFADDEIKLSISKRDITNSEELPGNVLSVYETLSSRTADTEYEVVDGEYGALVETWTSTNEPHMMTLLPQGVYILKEEQAVAGYTIAEDIVFKLNDTGVVQQIAMNNEHEAAVADELVETLGETGISAPLLISLAFISSIAFALGYRKRYELLRIFTHQ